MNLNDDVVDVADVAVDELDEAKQRHNAEQRRQNQERAQRRAVIEDGAAVILDAVGRVQTLIERGGAEDEPKRRQRRQILRGVRVGLLLMADMGTEDGAFGKLKAELGIG